LSNSKVLSIRPFVHIYPSICPTKNRVNKGFEAHLDERTNHFFYFVFERKKRKKEEGFAPDGRSQKDENVRMYGEGKGEKRNHAAMRHVADMEQYYLRRIEFR
jgi:hypothetical protein